MAGCRVRCDLRYSSASPAALWLASESYPSQAHRLSPAHSQAQRLSPAIALRTLLFTHNPRTPSAHLGLHLHDREFRVTGWESPFTATLTPAQNVMDQLTLLVITRWAVGETETVLPAIMQFETYSSMLPSLLPWPLQKKPPA